MATHTRRHRLEIDDPLYARIGWMIFSAMWVFILPLQWAEWLNMSTAEYETAITAWAGWKVIGLGLVLMFVGIYLNLFYNVFIVRRRWNEQFTPATAKFIRWSLMVIAVALNLLPVSREYGTNPSNVPNWAVAFTFVGVAWAITSSGRGAVISVFQVFGVASVMQLLQTPHLPQWGTVLFGLAIGLMVAGQVINQDLIGELYVERGRVKDQAVTDERFRIARDLHDTVGHSMTQITLKAELARRVLATDPQRAAQELGEVESLSRHLARDIRNAVSGDEQLSFADEVVRSRQFLESMNIASSYTGDAGELPREADELLAWCVREGVMNVVKHAGAQRAEISLTTSAGEYVLKVQDDGAAAPVPISQGRGLRGMRERVETDGGSVSFDAQAGEHVLTVRIPKP